MKSILSACTQVILLPIHMTSTYRFESVEHGMDIFAVANEGYSYTSVSNPTFELLQ